MNCYRLNCKDKCNDLKMMYCIHKLTDEQQKVIAKVKKNYCKYCGGTTVASKYSGQASTLCTSCGIVKQGDKVVKCCLVNSRRVS